MAGLDSNGFKRKQYSDIVSDMQVRAKNLFGENINLSDRSPLGIFIQVIAWSISIVWQLAEKVYYSAFVDYAEGNSLDNAARNGGIPRRGSEKATATARFSGTNATMIPSGFLIGTENEILFETLTGGTISGGYIDLMIQAVEGGIQANLPIGAINQIISPIAGLTSVSNTTIASGGRNIETDAEYRARYFLSLASAGASTIDAIISALLRTTGVKGANVEEIANVDGDIVGLRAITLGGSQNDIAQTLLDTKAWGVKTFGVESGTAKAINGQSYTINFDYATQIFIYANIVLTTNGSFNLDGEAKVKKAIAEYIGGTDTQGNIYVGLAMGAKVVYSKLIEVIRGIPGVEDVDIEISSDNITFAKSNIVIAFDEVVQTDPAKLVITYA